MDTPIAVKFIPLGHKMGADSRYERGNEWDGGREGEVGYGGKEERGSKK